MTGLLGVGLSLTPGSELLSWIAWFVALACGGATVGAIVAWTRTKSRSSKNGDATSDNEKAGGPHKPQKVSATQAAELFLILTVVLGGILFSYLALAHSEYRYEGEGVSFAQAFAERAEESGYAPSAPSKSPARSRSRIRVA